ncbi:MAG: single-stranded-DNA-specific exonuclease RecJ [Deltaproteobacteria bacterium]|nr:single-stranded-DNA-specific exonuclease RecJ [Deltaproteobacteria bacterium]MBW1985855.1 single-stranded-DNA-specific exonuclease RecJ [Deltaproteobacteria bacterium]MBW2133615.1 single-stranded-DNA-specific exonuclease RecJ [Deltaproteobacteria bacterium]
MSERHQLPELVARILLNRGLEEADDIEAFLDPTLNRMVSPLELRDLDPALERLTRAVFQSQPVVVYGDYDADGLTATALLLQFFRGLGLPATGYIPDRLTEGYGLHGTVLADLARQAQILITVDCGSSNAAEVAQAQRLGLEVIITDHHEVPDCLPPAAAVINPKRPDCPYPFKELAGVGVALNLAIGLRTRLREQGWFANRPEPNLRAYLDLVALGTAADVVPLIGQNRILTSQGLKVLEETTRPGLIALKEVAGLEGRPLGLRDVVFRLAPRINAAGRLGQARLALELLLTDDLDQARRLARHLHDLNQQRQALEEAILQEAETQIQRQGLLKSPALILAGEGWHPGVIGIVAARLAETYFRPVALVGLQDGVGKGSARSIAPFHLYHGLKACQPYLLKFGGHSAAAGFTLLADQLGAFRTAFEKSVIKTLGLQLPRPTLPVDAQVSLEELDDEFFHHLERLRPFGQGNPEPVLACLEVEVLNSWVVGDRHLKLQLAGPEKIDTIAFDKASYHPLRGSVDLAFSPRLAHFQGRPLKELRIRDFGKISTAA